MSLGHRQLTVGCWRTKAPLVHPVWRARCQYHGAWIQERYRCCSPHPRSNINSRHLFPPRHLQTCSIMRQSETRCWQAQQARSARIGAKPSTLLVSVSNEVESGGATMRSASTAMSRSRSRLPRSLRPGSSREPLEPYLRVDASESTPAETAESRERGPSVRVRRHHRDPHGPP